MFISQMYEAVFPRLLPTHVIYHTLVSISFSNQKVSVPFLQEERRLYFQTSFHRNQHRPEITATGSTFLYTDFLIQI